MSYANDFCTHKLLDVKHDCSVDGIIPDYGGFNHPDEEISQLPVDIPPISTALRLVCSNLSFLVPGEWKLCLWTSKQAPKRTNKLPYQLFG
jgi:hypothetical protein